MRIAICDDNKDDIRKLEQCVRNYSAKMDYKVYLETFTSGKALLSCEQAFDIYFLDYQMDEINGLDVARALKSKGFNGYIIFLTAYTDFMQEAFKVNTVDFIIKPLENHIDAVYGALNSLIKPRVLARSIKLTQKNGEEDLIHTHDIIYVEARMKNCKVCTAAFTREYRESFKTVCEMLTEKLFFKSHRSYIVSFEHVNKYSNSGRLIFMDNGEQIPMSRDSVENFSTALTEYTLGYVF